MLGSEYGDFGALYRCPRRAATPREPAAGEMTQKTAKPQSEAPAGRGLTRSVVLVGLMGAGKSCIGKRLAERLELPFVDADNEIEKAAGCSIADIFEAHGEQAFRDGERRVIARLLDGPPQVLATGGGAYMDPQTRETIRERGIAIWLRADLDLLVKRTAKRSHRPLLNKGNPRQILKDLMDQRYPVYAEADLVIDSRDGPPEDTVKRTLAALEAHIENTRGQATAIERSGGGAAR
jgi:shikimate kinase